MSVLQSAPADPAPTNQAGVVNAAQLPLARRLVAYVTVLLGYIFYCYHFVMPDFVRPNLIHDLGFSLDDTAWISVVGNLGTSAGAVVWAGVVARLGRRRTIAIIALTLGVTATIQALSGQIVVWLGVRGIMAAALGGYYVVATALVVALFPPGARGKLVAINSTMYPLSNILTGLVGGALGDAHWRVLLWIGAAPLALVLPLVLLVPDDRRYRAYETEEEAAAVGTWREMLSGRVKWLTVGCVLLAGLDFNAYQFFFSFVPLYMRDVQYATPLAVGGTVAIMSTGTLAGAFLWAALSDRFGRRFPLIGYLIAIAAILYFLFADASALGLRAAGFLFGFGMSCTSAWGAWFSEMFPPSLRAHGAALFHIGNMVALASPLLAAQIGTRFGLAAAMAIGAGFYVAGALLWWRLPETVGGKAVQHA